MQRAGWRDLDRAALDREYSPSSAAPGFRTVLRAYRERSDEALALLPVRRDLPYGAHPDERLHLFLPPDAVARPVPMLVFVHGGHWQELGPDDSCFAAPDALAAGAAFAAVGYGLAPDRTLTAMVDAVHRGLDALVSGACGLDVDPRRVVVSGSSAGAHLVAAALAHPDAPRVGAAALLSGAYDLEPLRHSYVNDAVGMDAREAADLSPLHLPPPRAGEVLLARGEHETGEYARQQDEYAAALRASGSAVTDLVAAGLDHFELPLTLAAPGSAVGDWVVERLADGPAASGTPA